MKVRLDFVTNSSSSSFIFGEPGKISGMTKEDIIKGIKDYANKLSEMRKFMDDRAQSKDIKFYNKILECRELERDYHESLLDNHSDLKCFKCKSFSDIGKCRRCKKDKNGRIFQLHYHLEKEIKESDIFKDLLKEAIDKYIKELNIDESDYEYFFTDYYLGLSDWESIEKFVKSDVENLITDFKETYMQDNDGYSDIRELLDWYGWDNRDDLSEQDKKEEEVYKLANSGYMEWCESYSSNCDKDCEKCNKLMEEKIEEASKTKINMNKIVFNHLGEYGIYGLWEGDIPYLIVLYLYKAARLGCNHMG